MNTSQRKIIMIGLALAAIACLFPPMGTAVGDLQHFHFVLNMSGIFDFYHVIWDRLFAEILVIIFGAAFLYLLKDKKKK